MSDTHKHTHTPDKSHSEPNFTNLILDSALQYLGSTLQSHIHMKNRHTDKCNPYPDLNSLSASRVPSLMIQVPIVELIPHFSVLYFNPLMINAILDSQGRALDVSAGSSLPVSIWPVPSLAQTAAAHVLKDKTTGAKTNQWREQRWADGASDSKMSAVSLCLRSLLILPPNYLLVYPIFQWMFCQTKNQSRLLKFSLYELVVFIIFSNSQLFIIQITILPWMEINPIYGTCCYSD